MHIMTHMKVPCHTCECGISRKNHSRHTCVRVMSHATRIDGSSHTYGCVMSRMDELCHISLLRAQAHFQTQFSLHRALSLSLAPSRFLSHTLSAFPPWWSLAPSLIFLFHLPLPVFLLSILPMFLLSHFRSRPCTHSRSRTFHHCHVSTEAAA